MVDPDNQYDTLGVIDTDEYAVVTATGASVTLELIDERLTQPRRLVSERSGDEFNDCRRDLGGQSVQSTRSLTGDLDEVRLVRPH